MSEVRQIDPRGPRFGAGITTVVLAAALVIGGTPGLALLGLRLGVRESAMFAAVPNHPKHMSAANGMSSNAAPVPFARFPPLACDRPPVGG